jgi:hypothetical protein
MDEATDTQSQRGKARTMTSAGRAYTTAGQEFAAFLRDYHIGTHNWIDVSRALISTGRGERWTEAVQDMAVLHLVRRLIAAASKIVGSRPEWDLVADSDIKQMIVDTMVVDYFLVNDIHARLVPAVAAARREISSGTRKQLKAESQRDAPWCYLCGAELEDAAADSPVFFTLDHVWPQAYGGDSDYDNLLPACQSCNHRKGHAASWSLYPIQALVHGYQLTAEDIANLPKEMRFAVLTRAAMDTAVADRLSLKEAFVSLGRPDLPTVVDESTSVDVFNLTAQFR